MLQTEPLILDIASRPRRNRKSPSIRSLVQETRLHPNHLVAPLFILEGTNRKQPIASMPGVERISIDLLIKEAAALFSLGVKCVDLFPVIDPAKKDCTGSESLRPGNLMEQAVQALKKELPEMCVMIDVALDPYTDHGHDGIVNDEGIICNDETVVALAEMSVRLAQAGVDVIAPSDMMDGRVAYIRKALDKQGFTDVSILSYTAKYASSFYGPFRDALQSAPKFGDKKTYQMNPANAREALLEASLDIAEGADMLLVKPALPYLDIVSALKQNTHLPIGAYHVSGEYAMVMAAAEKGWLDADRVFEESLLSIRRAGADFILTYAAKRYAENYRKL